MLSTRKTVAHGGTKPLPKDDWGILRNVSSVVCKHRPEPFERYDVIMEDKAAEEGNECEPKGARDYGEC